jgi:Effector protein
MKHIFCSLIFSFLFLVPQSSFSQSYLPGNIENSPPNKYALILPENEHFRTWTALELKSKITVNQDLIELNVCNGDEKKLLPNLLKENSKKDSLKIKAVSDGSIYTYIDEKIFDDKTNEIKISKIKDRFVKETLLLLSQLQKIPQGARLIGLLQKSLYSLTLVSNSFPRFEMIGSSGKPNMGFEEGTAIQHFVTLRKTGQIQIPFSQFGCGGNINYNPKMKMQNIESDDIKRDVPAVVMLAHELFHGFDGVRGLMDRRFVDGLQMESNEVSEFRATYFENQIRKAIGRKYRKYYSENKLGDSLLDKNNQPYLFPTPCLR